MSHPTAILKAIPLTRTRRIAVISLFTALAIATDYAMLPLTNIKLMDSIVFVSSVAFGFGVGASVGALTWLVYGTVNPLGSDSGFLLVLLMVSEMVYAVVGSVARNLLSSGAPIPMRSLLWGALGMIATFAYDINTIITPALVAGQPLSAAFASLLPATPFMIAHEGSNFVFFATVAPVLYVAVRRVMKVGAPSGPSRPDSTADAPSILDKEVH